MKKIFHILLIVLIFQCCTRENISDICPGQLKCNNLENPSGTGNLPDFSWILLSDGKGKSQTAWQIILDDDQDLKEADTPLFWNSGKIISNKSAWIRYSGPPLEPAKKYFWRLRIWDGEDKPSRWSEPAYFITGLFDRTDWENAKWIGYEEIPDSLILVPGVHGDGNNLGEVAIKKTVIPCFRKEFTVDKKIEQALVFVCGLGHYELTINGNKTGNRFLSPGWTNYHKTCFYNTFNVTADLKKGVNAIGIIAGNGFYNVNRERYRKLVIAYGAPKVILKLRILFGDGSTETIVSDESWKTAPSPITFSSIYGGEDYNAELEQPGWNNWKFDDSAWQNAIIAREPGGTLKPETDYPVRVMETFDPVSVTNPDSGKYVYDIHNLYNKIIDDMIEAQLENGLVPDIAPEFVPFSGGFRDSPEWGSACVILPWDMYE